MVLSPAAEGWLTNGVIFFLQLKEFEVQNRQTCRSEPTEWAEPSGLATNESFSCTVSLWSSRSEGILRRFFTLNHNFRECVGLSARPVPRPLSFPRSVSRWWTGGPSKAPQLRALSQLQASIHRCQSANPPPIVLRDSAPARLCRPQLFCVSVCVVLWTIVIIDHLYMHWIVACIFQSAFI